MLIAVFGPVVALITNWLLATTFVSLLGVSFENFVVGYFLFLLVAQMVALAAALSYADGAAGKEALLAIILAAVLGLSGAWALTLSSLGLYADLMIDEGSASPVLEWWRSVMGGADAARVQPFLGGLLLGAAFYWMAAMLRGGKLSADKDIIKTVLWVIILEKLGIPPDT